MNTHKVTEARTEFRIVAGLLAALLLLVGIPISIMLAIGGPWYHWLGLANELFFGIGFFRVARTGGWFSFRKRHEKDAA